MLFKVTLMPHKTEVWLPANAPLTDLEYELIGKLSIPFGCRAGACGVCAIEVIEGINDLGEKEANEASFLEELGYVGDRYRLACQCRVLGETTIRVADYTE